MSRISMFKTSLAVSLIFAPVAFVAATGDLNRQLDPASVVDYGLIFSALFFPTLGGLILLKSRKSEEALPSQLKEALEVIGALKG